MQRQISALRSAFDGQSTSCAQCHLQQLHHCNAHCQHKDCRTPCYCLCPCASCAASSGHLLIAGPVVTCVIPQDLRSRPVWVALVQRRNCPGGLQMPMLLYLAVAHVCGLAVPPIVGQMSKHARPAPAGIWVHHRTHNALLLSVRLNGLTSIDDNLASAASRRLDCQQIGAVMGL